MALHEETQSMPDLISGLMNETTIYLGTLHGGATEWLAVFPSVELGEPSTLLLLGLALLAGLVSRSVFVLLGAVAWAILGVHLVSIQPPTTEAFITSASIAAQALLLTAAYSHHRHRKRAAVILRGLEIERRRLEADLDREILWRRAGDDENEIEFALTRSRSTQQPLTASPKPIEPEQGHSPSGHESRDCFAQYRPKSTGAL
jgi:hypothetical protein